MDTNQHSRRNIAQFVRKIHLKNQNTPAKRKTNTELLIETGLLIFHDVVGGITKEQSTRKPLRYAITNVSKVG